MGIVNVTPDSFSDGGKYLETKSAIEHGLMLASEGAAILDIGGASSRPGSEGVTADLELGRVIPVIEGIRRQSDIPISIDTTKAIVASKAIDAGCDMINDISAGRFDPEMLILAAGRNVPICLMHMKGTPKDMQDDPHYSDMIGEISSFLRDAARRAIDAGISSDNIILDPGVGFGKTAQGNLEIIRRVSEFKALGHPILIGASNKSFIGKMLGCEVEERLEATLATIPACIDGGSDIIRLHDVKAARRFIDMYTLLRNRSYH